MQDGQDDQVAVGDAVEGAGCHGLDQALPVRRIRDRDGCALAAEGPDQAGAFDGTGAEQVGGVEALDNHQAGQAGVGKPGRQVDAVGTGPPRGSGVVSRGTLGAGGGGS